MINYRQKRLIQPVKGVGGTNLGAGEIPEPSIEGDAAEDKDEVAKLDPQANGVLVLSLLDKIIGAVDQIQQTQSGLEARQQDMERSVTSIQGELSKLSKSHSTTSNSVSKMMEKVRKVSVNVKTVQAALEKQGGQIKKLENNEAELLKRRNFKVMIYQDEVKIPSKLSISKSMKVSESEPGEDGEGEKADKPHVDLSSDEEGYEIEETIEESRAERIKRSSLQRVQTLKTVFSKEKMDKTRKTKENLEKTKQKTRENLEKTRHNIEKKMGKLGTRMSVNPERKQKMQTSRDKVKKAFTPDHVVYARSKTAVYKVPPFTFHVKKVREGAVEVVQGTEMVEVSQDADPFGGVDGEVEEGAIEVEMEMMNGGGDEEEVEEDEEEDSHDALEENEERDRDSD
uniref:Caveolae associated protein 1b n=1 Tax=Seriola lalandi dorsalis TaxID=1841481 RepID=A0A3B4YAR1_SERLL